MRQPLLKQQPILRLSGTQGTEQTHTVPSTLTKIILVLLTMLLLPNAAWGQEQAHDFYVKIGGIKVSANNNEITGEGISFGENGFISYSHDESTGTGTLTLKNATINYTGNEQALITSNTVDKLIIELRGNNIIQTTQDVNAISGNITLKSIFTVIEFTSTTQDGSLLLENKATDANAAVISSTVTINNDSYKNGLEPRIIYFTAMSSLTFATKAVIAIPYGISIAGVEVTSANNTNILNDANKTVSFTPANATTSPATPATLKLKGASISGGGIYTTLEDLEIDLENTNTILTGQYEGTGTSYRNGIMSTKNGTLTFVAASGGSLEITSTAAAIKGFQTINGYLETHVPYTIKSKNDNYPNQDLYRTCEIEGDSVAIKWIKISEAQTYPLWIAGTQVTEVNASNITGTGITVSGSTEEGGGISFSNTDNQLTLKNVTIDYSNTFADPIISSIDNLKVKLIGINKINIADISYCGFKYTGTNGTLTFVNPTRFSEIGLLEITYQASQAPFISYSNLCSGYTITDFDNFMDGGTNDSDYTPANSGWVKSMVSNYFVKVRYIELYDLWIGGTRITSANLTGNGYQNYDPGQSSIKYSGATSSARIVSNLPELTIILSGENSLNVTDGTDPAISFTASEKTPTGKLVFTKDKNTTSTINRMTIDCANGAIVGFSEVTTDDPLKLSVPTTAPATWDNSTTKVVITDETLYDLWVEGIRVTSENMDNVKGEYIDPQNPTTPSVVFDSETSTLNLTNANIIVTTSNENLNGGVVSGLENLTVKFKGSNSIKGSGVTTFYGFKAWGDKTCNITFTASESFDFMAEAEPEYAVSGFSKVTYKDDLGAFTDNGCFYICEELSLGFDTTFDDNYNPIGVKIMSGGEIVSHKIVYAIDYAKDDLEDIPETEYTSVIPLATITAGPCIFTAYTLSLDGENTKSNNLKYYYFQYSDSEVIIGNGTTIDLKDYLLPTLTGDDEVELFNSSDTEGYNYISISEGNNTITGIAYGTATVSSSTEGVNTFTFGSGYELSIQVKVQDIIDESTFASGQNYCTFYNKDHAYNVPEGLKAYIIKNVDEEKGEIVTEETSVLPPNTPLLLYRTSTSGSANYVFTKASGVEPANTVLLYTTTEKTAEETSKLYVLYNDQFVKVTAGTKILANHCYLNLANSAGTRGFYSIGAGIDGTSAIDASIFEELSTEGDVWYDLQGRRIAKPTKAGLYIINGKKVVLK